MLNLKEALSAVPGMLSAPEQMGLNQQILVTDWDSLIQLWIVGPAWREKEPWMGNQLCFWAHSSLAV